jgi:DNA-binding NtrC family response regulator
MNRKLLLVDDEVAIRALMAMDLQRIGFEVTAVASGEEALEVLELHHFNLMVTDLLLTEGDGLELLEICKERHRHLPVLILTGMGFDDALVQEAFRKGADGYVSKGLTMSHLRTEINRVLKKAAAELNSTQPEIEVSK